MEYIQAIYIIIGVITVLYLLFTEDDFVLDGSFSNSLLIVLIFIFAPLVLLWLGFQTLLESSPKSPSPSPPSSKIRKSDEELIKDFENTLKELKKLFNPEEGTVNVKVTKGHIASAQKLGALSRKLVVKPYLDKVQVTEILNKALAQLDTVYPNDSSTALARKTAIEEHLSKINRTKKSKTSKKSNDTSKLKTPSNKKPRNKGPKKDTLGFDLSNMTKKDMNDSQQEKNDGDEKEIKNRRNKKNLSVSIKYD